MAAANIYKYTILTIVIFSGTKILHFVKQSNENLTRHLPKDDSNMFNNADKQDTWLINQKASSDENDKEINETGEKITDITTGTTKWRKMTNSTTLTNRLQRKRKLLAQMWDNYYKVKASTTSRINDNSAFHQVGDDIFAFSAFYDNRKIKHYQNPVVRVLTISKLHSKANLECKFSATGAGQWVQAIKHELSDNHGKAFGGVLYTCNIPQTARDKPPKTVYLQSLLIREDNFSKVTSELVTMEVIPVEMPVWKSTIYHRADNFDKLNTDNLRAEDAKHFLETFPNDSDLKKINKLQEIPAKDQERQLHSKIVKNHKELSRTDKNGNLHSISICIPPLFGDTKLSEFIQFVEIQKILGVSHLFFYKMNVSSDIERMLHYYKSLGTVTIINWQLSRKLQDSTNIWYNGQTTALQDCLYRNTGKFDFTAFLDIDEVIVPHSDADLPKMLEKLEKSYTKDKNTNSAAFVFQSGFFEPDVKLKDTIETKYQKLSLLRNIYRNEVTSSVRTKVIVKPEYIEHIGIHHVSKLVSSDTKLDITDVPVKTALIHHNRKCTTALDSDMHCGKYVADTSILKYSDILEKNYEQALENNLEYFKTFRQM